METDKKAREDGLFTPPRMLFLVYVVFLLSILQSSVLIVIWGHVSGFPQWTLLSSGNSLSKVGELFEIEKRFAAEVVGKNFYFGFGMDSEDGTDLASGFLVTTPQFPEKSFIFTASHMIGMIPYRVFKNLPFNIFLPGGEKIEVMTELTISPAAELAAAYMPELVTQKITPALLSTGDDKDLIRGVTPLAVLCNPLRFAIPLRVGFFGGFNELGYLTIEFSGLAAQNGCSGGPIVDSEMRVRALVTETSTHSVAGIPSKIIAQFLAYHF